MNPFRPGSLKVADIFAQKGQVCPFLETGPFKDIQEMLAVFDKPEELFIVTYGPTSQAIAHKRDSAYIEEKRLLTDQFLAKTGKEFGQLTLQEALWVKEQVDQALLRSN